MKQKMKPVIIVWLQTLMLLPLFLQAQHTIRPEDHFYRRKVVNRIDLREKMNRPIVYQQSSYYGTNGTQGTGLVASLIEGLKQGTFVAYDPDDLTRVMSYDEVLERMKEFEGQLSSSEEEMWTLEEEAPGLLPDDGFLTDDLSGGLSPEPWVPDPNAEPELAPYENVVQLVEDRIFDKARGEMVYRPELFQLIWTDPGESLPEKYLACFRYSEVAETLEEVPWQNRFNDAEMRNLREVFEMRMFHGYIIEVSGQGVRSLPEAEFRRQQLVAFEHHLWSY